MDRRWTAESDLAGSRWVFLATSAHLAAYAFDLGAVAQLPTALLFYLSCPGMIVIDWPEAPQDLLSRAALGIAVSLAVNIIVVTLLLSGGLFSGPAGLAVIATISIVGVMAAGLVQPVSARPLDLAARPGR